jgi:ubiquinone/menaquinone biosynthesis C-methylase UbiE
MKPYIFDDASTLEYQRLDLMSKILDPWTRGYLTALGVGEGWRCLELGGGNGSIAEWLSATVSPIGWLAVDSSRRQRSRLLQRCLTTRTTGPSAG